MEPATKESDPLLISLERRVQRLEDAVASLKEKQVLPQVKAGPRPLQADTASPEKPMNESADHPEQAPYAGQGPPLRSPWLLVEIYEDLKAMVRMFFDIHYHVAWSTRLIAFILVVMIFTSQLWFPLEYFPFLGRYFDKVLDFLLAFLAFKVLSREARRYRRKRTS